MQGISLEDVAPGITTLFLSHSSRTVRGSPRGSTLGVADKINARRCRGVVRKNDNRSNGRRRNGDWADGGDHYPCCL